jgi:hypothetical protein
MSSIRLSVICAISALTGVVGAVWAQQKVAGLESLTAADRFEIEQLIFKYGHAIDTCANNGYDYADLYTDDGEFIDAFTDEGFAANGLVRAVGREQLARAAGGGSDGCENVGWKDWSHLMINPVIAASGRGATARTYLVVIGEQGPNHVQRFGGYEDEFVRTPDGWRIKRRTHVRNKAWSNPLLQTPDLN